MKRTLIIDGQIFQTSAWNRGMGRYLMCLFEAVNAPHFDEYILMLNDNLELSSERLQQITSRINGFKIVRLNLPHLGEGQDFAEHRRRASLILDTYIATELIGHEVTFLITASFTFDFTPVYPAGTRRAIIVFDLIPLLRWAEYKHLFPQHEYLARFELIYQADHVFTISEAVRTDILKYLGRASSVVSSIDGAYIPNGVSKEVVPSKAKHPYILLPTGNMPHKNNRRAVEGFARFNHSSEGNWRLMITSNFDEATRLEYQAISSDIVFVGSVSDAELEQLYTGAEAILFPSEMEGLGLPILEGVHYRKPIACSNLPVFSEISRTGFKSFDPSNSREIATALAAAITDPLPAAEYDRIEREYTWSRSAAKLVDGLSLLDATPRLGSRIALIVGTDVATVHFQGIYGQLSTDAEITVFVDDAGADTAGLFIGCFETSRSMKELSPDAYSRFDDVVYVVSPHSTPRLVAIAATLPGIAAVTPNQIDWDQIVADNPIWTALSSSLAIWAEPEIQAIITRHLQLDVPLTPIKYPATHTIPLNLAIASRFRSNLQQLATPNDLSEIGLNLRRLLEELSARKEHS